MSDADSWREWVGRKGVIVPGPYPISVASIGYLAEALQDERLAAAVARGTPVAPRSFVTIASRVPQWRPSGAIGPDSFMQAMLVPLPANSGVNLGIDQKYYAPLLPGDTLGSQSVITGITPKATRLGEGFIVVELIKHRNQDDTLVATTQNTLLRFAAKPKEPEAAAAVSDAAPAPVEPPAVPSDFPIISQTVTMTMLAKAAGAVRDYAPLHHDIELARAAGHPTAFLSYSHQLAIITSAIGRWFGSDERMRRLQLTMKRSVYLGDTFACAGVRQPSDDPDVDIIEVSIATAGGVCSIGLVEIKTGGSALWS